MSSSITTVDAATAAIIRGLDVAHSAVTDDPAQGLVAVQYDGGVIRGWVEYASVADGMVTILPARKRSALAPIEAAAYPTHLRGDRIIAWTYTDSLVPGGPVTDGAW